MKRKVRDCFENFFTAYLRERNLEKTLACVSDDIISLGTGSHEIAVGRESFTELYRTEFETSPAPLDFEMRDFRAFPSGPSAFTCFSNVRVLLPGDGASGGKSIELCTGRFTGVCTCGDGSWTITSLHMSLPFAEQREDSFFPDLYYKGERGASKESACTLDAMIPSVLPGGILGAYAEPGLPFYAVNDELLRYMGFTYDAFMEATGEMTVNVIHPDDRNMVERLILSSLQTTGEYELQFRLMQKGASFIWVYARGKKVTSLDGRDIFVSVLIDISKMVVFQEQLKMEASHDVLTPLLNRKAAVKLIETSFMHYPEGFFFILDMDNFKKLNDTLGHHVGDIVLKDMANILLAHTRTTDIVARLGGDEFTIYYPGLTDLSIARERAEQFQQDFRKLTQKKYPSVNLSISIGAARRLPGMTFDEIYSDADHALYSVKNSGKCGYCLYDENLAESSSDEEDGEEEEEDA